MIETLSQTEKKILTQLQEGIPLTSCPFDKLASEIGISEKEYIDTIKKLKDSKIIRQISPIYDTKSLGYDSSLVAFKVKDIENAVEIINKHPGVSHNYERTDDFNLWFTIAVPPNSKLGLEKTVNILAEKTQAEKYVILKTLKLYKIGVKLDINGNGTKKKEKVNRKKKKEYSLLPEDREIMKITQEDIPLTSQPFKEYADILGISEEKLLEKLQLYLDAGIMRRFAAILFHRKAGFQANGMTVWKISEDKVDEIGYKLASFKAVSHCYKRTTNDVWQYNLFSMIHAKTKEELEEFVSNIAQEENLTDYRILYSIREFKKKRIRYFSDDFYKWEEEVFDGKHT